MQAAAAEAHLSDEEGAASAPAGATQQAAAAAEAAVACDDPLSCGPRTWLSEGRTWLHRDAA